MLELGFDPGYVAALLQEWVYAEGEATLPPDIDGVRF